MTRADPPKDDGAAKGAVETPHEQRTQAQRVGGGAVWGQAGRVFENGLSLLFSVLVVRVLGPERYGIYAVGLSVVGVALLMVSLGYNETLARYLPTYRARFPGQAPTFVKRLLRNRLLVGLVVAFTIWLLRDQIAVWTATDALVPLVWLLAILLLGQNLWDFFSAYFAADLRIRNFALVRALGQISGVSLAAGLFVGFGPQIWVPVAGLIANYTVGIAAFVWSVRTDLLARDVPVDLATVYSFSRYVWVTNLATFGLANQVDILLIASLMTNATQVAFYGVAATLLGRLYTLLSGWTVVVMPAATERLENEGFAGLARSFAVYMKVNLLLMVAPFVLTAALAQPIVVALFNPSYLPAASLLATYALLSTVSVLVGANICYPFLYVTNRQKLLLGLRIGAGVLNVILNLALIPRYGAVGAIWATGLSNLTAHIVEFVILVRLIGGTYPTRVAVKIMGAACLAAFPVAFLPGTNWLALLAGCALFLILFLGLLRWWRPLSLAEIDLIVNLVPRLRPVLRRLLT
ncbi:oligosaccharide flippase family protein [bacterium]|nr:oligosaccharide flippase family protein [bacterium]